MAWGQRGSVVLHCIPPAVPWPRGGLLSAPASQLARQRGPDTPPAPSCAPRDGELEGGRWVSKCCEQQNE